MALLTIPSITKGTAASVSLNKTELFALAAVAADEYFSVATNVKRCIIELNSNPGNQRKILQFDLSQTTPTASVLISLKGRNSFLLERLVLEDNDGGLLILERSQLPSGLDVSLGGGSGGAASLPVSSGLYSWFRADSLQLQDGQVVTSWADESNSSGSAAFVQNASNPAPLYVASSINGKPAIRNNLSGGFSPSDSRHLVMNRPFPATDSTIFVVAKGAAGATNSGALISQASSFAGSESPLAVRHRADLSGKPIWGYTSLPLAQPNVGDAGENAFVLSMAADKDVENLATSSLKYFLNGVLTATTPGHYMNSMYYSPSQKLWLFNFYSWNFVGDIAEIIIYDRVLSTEERNQVTQHLAQKYAITVA